MTDEAVAAVVAIAAVAAVREQVALSCRILGALGQGDLVWGHVAARDPLGRGAWIKASGWGLEEITPERVHLVDRNGKVIEGEGRRHLEYPIHLEILAARPDVMAVVHTHPSSAVALAATGQPLRPVSHDATYFGPDGVARFDATSELIRNQHLGKDLAAALGRRRGVILARHGIVTVGPDVPMATLGAIFLERGSETQLRAAAAGLVDWSSDAELEAKRQGVFTPEQVHVAWAYLARTAGSRPVPDCA